MVSARARALVRACPLCGTKPFPAPGGDAAAHCMAENLVRNFLGRKRSLVRIPVAGVGHMDSYLHLMVEDGGPLPSPRLESVVAGRRSFGLNQKCLVRCAFRQNTRNVADAGRYRFLIEGAIGTCRHSGKAYRRRAMSRQFDQLRRALALLNVKRLRRLTPIGLQAPGEFPKPSVAV